MQENLLRLDTPTAGGVPLLFHPTLSGEKSSLSFCPLVLLPLRVLYRKTGIHCCPCCFFATARKFDTQVILRPLSGCDTTAGRHRLCNMPLLLVVKPPKAKRYNTPNLSTPRSTYGKPRAHESRLTLLHAPGPPAKEKLKRTPAGAAASGPGPCAVCYDNPTHACFSRRS